MIYIRHTMFRVKHQHKLIRKNEIRNECTCWLDHVHHLIYKLFVSILIKYRHLISATYQLGIKLVPLLFIFTQESSNQTFLKDDLRSELQPKVYLRRLYLTCRLWVADRARSSCIDLGIKNGGDKNSTAPDSPRPNWVCRPRIWRTPHCWRSRSTALASLQSTWIDIRTLKALQRWQS